MGDIIKWINKDICSEEMDTLTASGLEYKDVVRRVSTKVKDIINQRL